MQVIEELNELTNKENGIKTQDEKEISESHSKIKLIELGWKHRFSVSEDYELQKSPNGGTKKIELDTSVDYSSDEIINLGIAKFNSDFAKKLLKHSRIELSLPNGIAVSNASFSNDMITNNVLLFLLSTSEAENVNAHKKEEVVKSKIDFKTELQSMTEISRVPEQICNEIIKDENSITFTEPISKASENNILDTCLVEKNNDFSQSTFVDFKIEQNVTNQNILNSLNSKEIQGFYVNEAKSSSADVIINDYSIIHILYSFIKTSKYSGELVISETDKSGIYWKLLDEEEDISCEIQDFDPIDYGSEISRIIRNGKTLYQILIDENLRKTYNFSDSYKEQASHAIIYDIDEVFGFFHGKFGIGIVTTCSDDCKPIFSWYLNDVLFKKGQKLIWLNNVPLLDTENIWRCEVKCTKNSLVSKTIKINDNECTSIELKTKIVPQIKKRDFVISSPSSRVTRRSQGGNIYKGYYSGRDVTIKLVKMSSTVKKALQKKDNVLEGIEHVNFISLMGICKGLKQLYLIMEYFEGEILKDVIFDNEMKKLYGIDDHRKKQISQQISKAITFLHLQETPIVFKHICTGGILINKSGLIKMYDISLCTFLQNTNTKTLTMNNYLVSRTTMYIAPEILINNEQASIQSDVWSLACTLSELYREEIIWNIKNQKELKQKLLNKEIPNLSGVPEYLLLTLSKSFSYNINDRPSVRDILKIFLN